ncbi:MAG: penicillin-binding protein [Lachnospiraceae bacterium]|nr:penicillin-binding protein [Lachnospiraceae bacterium]
MSNQGDFNGNSNGRRNIGSSNNRVTPGYGNGSNGFSSGRNYNSSNNNNNKYSKYGASNNSTGTYNKPNNSNNLNGHNGAGYGNNLGNNVNNLNSSNNSNNRYAEKYTSNNNMQRGQYQGISGLDEDYDSMNLQMDETTLEDVAAAKRADRIAKIKLGIKVSSIALLAIVLVAGIFIYVKYGATIMQLRKEAIEQVGKCSKETFTKKSASKYYAKQGGKWTEMEFASQTKYKYMSMSDGGEQMDFASDLFYLSEDRNFYKHKGVDLMANVKAVVLVILNGGEVERGGSTITQQLARNVILEDFDRNWQRKVKEIFVSWELEEKFKSKETIMEFYINNINYSNGYQGIESAAQGYFGKSITKLTKAEVAFLCAIPNNPTLYNPYTNKENVKKGAQKKDYVKNRAKNLVRQVFEFGKGKLNKAEYNAIVADIDKIEIKDEVTATTGSKTVKIDRQLKNYILDSAAEYAMEHNFGFKFDSQDQMTDPAYKASYEAKYADYKATAENYLNSTGAHIYTSIDLDAQKSLQDSIDTKVKGMSGGKKQKEDGTFQIQSAGVCIDNKTGRVVAMVNARSSDIVNYLPRAYGEIVTKNDGTTKYNYANQPGSAIKPLLVYGPAFDKRDEATGKALFTCNTLVEDDGEVERTGATPVGNSNDVYKGTISILEAIKGSSNVVAYKMYSDMFKENRKYAIRYLDKMNFKFLTSTDRSNAGVSIGGFSYGSTPLEMAAAYATIANDGEYRKPSAILNILSEGEINTANPLDFDETKVKGIVSTGVRIYEQSTARRLTQAMQQVFQGPIAGGYSGTAAGKGVSIDCAGKTGTTNGKMDAWFCGYTSAYTTAIWVGDDDNKKTAISGGNVATIWKTFNQAVINKKRLSPTNNKFNLVIMDDSEPEQIFSLEPTETTFEFFTEDPFASIMPTPTWSETYETYTYEPYTEAPTQDPWITSEPVTEAPTQDFDDDDDDDDDDGWEDVQPEAPTNPGGNPVHGGGIWRP